MKQAAVEPMEGRLLLLGYFSLCKSDACSLEGVVIRRGESVVETEPAPWAGAGLRAMGEAGISHQWVTARRDLGDIKC